MLECLRQSLFAVHQSISMVVIARILTNVEATLHKYGAPLRSWPSSCSCWCSGEHNSFGKWYQSRRLLHSGPLINLLHTQVYDYFCTLYQEAWTPWHPLYYYLGTDSNLRSSLYGEVLLAWLQWCFSSIVTFLFSTGSSALTVRFSYNALILLMIVTTN